MNFKKYRSRFLLVFATLTLLFSSVLLTSCQGKKIKNTVFSVDDLAGKTIGVQLGTTGDTLVSDYETDGSGTTVSRYNKGSDAIQALKQGKADAVVIDEQPALAFVKANPDLTILEEEFANEDYAICVAKGNSLTAKLNEAIEVLMADGTIQKLIDDYVGDNATFSGYKSPDGISRTNGTLVMATNAYFKPYEYYEGGSIIGIDADIAQAIADYLGMNLKIEDMEFDSIITAVSSGKADFGMAGMTVTDERKKNIDFTTTYTTSKQVIIVRDDNASASGMSFAEKFKTDFIKEARYTYLLKGLLNTVIIAFFAALMGVVIGFLIAVVRSNHDKTGHMKILNFICNIYLTVIRGTPTMVQLLIIYYVIFSSVHIDKLIVAILAFGINSGAYVAEIFRSGIMSIDNGQFEAARSLGLSYKTTMISVILPQAFLAAMNFAVVFVLMYLGTGAVDSLLAVVPQNVLHALGLLGGVLPAVGMAMLLKFNIVGNWMFIFFVLGFMMVSSMSMGFIPIAIFAAALAFLYWKIDSRPEVSTASASANVFTDDDEVEL